MGLSGYIFHYFGDVNNSVAVENDSVSVPLGFFLNKEKACEICNFTTTKQVNQLQERL